MSELDKNILKLRQKLLLDTRIGYLGNGSGEVHDRRNPGRYYVRFSQAGGGYTAPVSISAHPNINLPTSDGLPVDIGYDASGQMIIVRANVPGMAESGYNALQLNPLDSQSTAFINQTQITTFYAARHPDLNNKPFTVVVFSGFYTDTSGNLIFFPGGEIDLTSLQPTSPDHCYVVVFRKDDATLEAFASTPINVSDPLTIVDLQECLDAATANSERIWAWEIRHDDTELTVDPARQIDLRTIVGASVSGGVTSVAFTAAPASVFGVTGSPITGSGTIALSMDNQSAHTGLMGPTSGGAAAPAFRAINGDDVFLPKNGSPTYLHAEDANTLVHSAGILDPTITYITQVDATHINVAAGKGAIRTSNAAAGQLVFFDWPASNNIAIPAGASGVDSVRYIGVEYNSGTPQVTVRTSFDWNWYNDFPLGRVSQDGTTLRILNAYAHAEDTASLTRRFLRLIFPFRREEPPEGSGGLVIGDVSGRKLSMSAGNVWHGFNKYVLSAVDTSGAGTFDLHYRNGTGGFTHVASQTTWPNTQYDNNSGTLATMTAAKYANLWIYVDVSDGSLDVLYGRDQYTSVALAQAEAVPSTIPGHLLAHGRLLGRLIFQKSATTAALVESVWATTFTGAPVLALDDLTDVTITSAAKGNLLAYSTSWVNLPVGTNGQVLTADSTASAGVTWKDNATSVTNSSGATANAGDVGYIDSTGVYKTTTTAGDIVAWCAVVTGGANTATITVITSGRITLNYTGSAPSTGDCLITSTTGGLVQAQAYYSPGVVAVALAGGSGGTVDALLLIGRVTVPASNANFLFNNAGTSTSLFTTTVSGSPGGTGSFTYGATASGNENVANQASTDFARIVWHNLTHVSEAIQSAINTGTNVVTTQSNVPASWANNDSLTIESQTAVTGTTGKCVDLDLSNSAALTAIPNNAVGLLLELYALDTGAANNFTIVHPYESFASSKQRSCGTPATNVGAFVGSQLVALINRRITVRFIASGAGTLNPLIKLTGYIVATP